MRGSTGRVLIYSHDTYGIGNVRRTLEVCRALSAEMQDISVLVITGSPLVESFEKPANVDYVKLPEVKRAARGKYGARATNFVHGTLRQMREEICQSAVLRFAPDFILVDKGPFGVDGELRPALEALDAERSACIKVLALRDILDEPDWVRQEWRSNGTTGDILRHYDAVWVFGQQLLFDVAAEYDFPPALRERLTYLGFIGRSEPIAAPEEVRLKLGIGDGPLLLVTPGGGDDGDALLSTFVAALPRIRATLPKLAAVVVSGPQSSATVRNRVAQACAQDARAIQLTFAPDILSIMNAADAMLCMGGYNTMCEVLMLGKPATVVPRCEPVREQLIRARILAKHGAVRLCEPARLDSHTVAREVEQLMAGWRPRPLDPSLSSFDAHQRAARAVREVLAGEAGGPSNVAALARARG